MTKFIRFVSTTGVRHFINPEHVVEVREGGESAFIKLVGGEVVNVEGEVKGIVGELEEPPAASPLHDLVQAMQHDILNLSLLVRKRVAGVKP